MGLGDGAKTPITSIEAGYSATPGTPVHERDQERPALGGVQCSLMDVDVIGS